MGAGPAIVVPHAIFEQFNLAWQMPEWRRFLEQLGEDRQLVMYDGRGFGLSERETDDFSLETKLWDIEAVVEATKLRRFALFAFMFAGSTAIAYAARYRRRVTRLILYGTYSEPVFSAEQVDAVIALCRTDWRMASQLLADSTTREEYSDSALAIAEHWRQSTSGEIVAKRLSQHDRADVTDLLSQVRVPTLVLHRRGDPTFALGRRLAAAIPNARFVPLEGSVNAYWLGDCESILNPIREFLEEGDEATATRAADPLPAGDVHTILFTDMASSTALTQQLGDAAAQEVRRTHNQIVRTALSANDGSEIKHTGDGIMASFSTASSALDCAIAIQRGVAHHVEAHPDTPLGLYVGLNAGEPIAEEQDLFGTSVDLAKRICDHAEPGQVLASDVVRQLAAGKQFLFADLGETALRGFEDPVRLYEVRWREDG